MLIKPRQLLILGICSVVVLTMVWFAFPFHREVVVSLPIRLSEGNEPTDEQALEITRQALQDAGLESKNFTPIPYFDTPTGKLGHRYFAASNDKPNRGFIQWKQNDMSDSEYSYYSHLVRCEFGDSSALCTVDEIM